jgi:hypothetical protein
VTTGHVYTSAVEWYEPTESSDRWDGTNTSSAQLQHDAGTGEIFIHVQVGDCFAYFKPETLAPGAQALERYTRFWVDCHWDLEVIACSSKLCRFTQDAITSADFAPGGLPAEARDRPRA